MAKWVAKANLRGPKGEPGERGPVGPAGEAWAKPVDATIRDINLYTDNGFYRVTASGVANRPVAAAGLLEVTGVNDVVTQRWTTLEPSPRVFIRSRTAAGVWSTWMSAMWSAPATITGTGDLNAATTPGSYVVTGGAAANKPTTGLGLLETFLVGTGSIMQRWTPYNSQAAVWTRSFVSGAWSAWTSTTWWKGQIVAGVDFDTLVTPGSYSATFLNHPHQPVARAGVLSVEVGGTVTVQRYRATTGGARATFERSLSGATWSDWIETTGSGSSNPGTGGPAAPLPLPAYVPTLTARNQAEIVTSYSRDRMLGFNGQHSGGKLRTTRDDGLTWSDMHTFAGSFIWVRQLANGELLACVGTNPAPRTLWVSSGFSTSNPTAATWSKVLTASADHIYFAQAWSVSTHENIVVVGEYGPKKPTWNGYTITDPARYVYLSLDYGRTFTQVFDLVEYLTNDRSLATTDGQHVHGVAWDPYWDRIWVTFGDDTNGIVYSDDLGATWQTADWGPVPAAPMQAVGIAAMRDAVLFASDGVPNGVYRIDRAQGKRTGSYVLEAAWTVPDDPGRLAFLCQSILRVPKPDGSETVLFGFGAETTPGKSFIVGTRDGFSFQQVWVDPVESPSGFGIRTMAGPSLRGALVVGSNDQRTPSAWSEWRGPAPSY